MHIHVAIFKWKQGVDRADVDAQMQAIRSIADRVPGIDAIYCGPNTSKWGMGYTDAVVVLGRSASAIEQYRHDSVHEAAAKVIDAMELEGIGVDFTDG